MTITYYATKSKLQFLSNKKYSSEQRLAYKQRQKDFENLHNPKVVMAVMMVKNR